MEPAYVTGVIDLTAHSISFFRENESPQNIKDTFMSKSSISIAEPYDVQIDELGDNVIQMYQFIGDMTQKLLDQGHYSIIWLRTFTVKMSHQ